MENAVNKKQEFKNLIIELVKLFKPDTYVEIGARFGYVFNDVAAIVKRAVAVDIIPMYKIEKRSNVELYQMSSLEFSEKWYDPIDLLFIDADHNADAVLQDFVALGPLVKEHTGLILLHDTYPVKPELIDPKFCGDAWRIAKYIHKIKEFEIVTLPGPWAGLSIVRKVSRSFGWMDS